MANDNNEARKCSNENENISKAERSTHNEAEALCEGKEDKDNSSNGSEKIREGADCQDAKASRSLLNDLVADLCISSSSPNSQIGRCASVVNSNNGFGDYTNIRATTGFKQYQAENLTTSSTSSSVGAQASQAPVQNSSSSFSFKHFLNSSSAVTAPSTTVTSLDPMIGIADSTSGSTVGNQANSSSNLQTSTGARPKVPQSASVCGQISSLAIGVNLTNSGNKVPKDTTASKMKRSPRFSSFDSQASLAEYTSGASDFNCSQNNDSDASNFKPALDSEEHCDDYFNTSNFSPRAPVSSSTNKSADYDSCQYLPRSYSNYDLPSGTPRRRLGFSPSNRPNRLALNYNASNLSNSSTDFDLPSTSAAAAATGTAAMTSAGASGSSSSLRQQGNNLNELPHGAAVLPDFVQDHWLDSWYAHDMHLNSPPNSPISDFVEDANATSGLGASSSNFSGQAALKRENLSAECNSNSGNNLLGNNSTLNGAGGVNSSGNGLGINLGMGSGNVLNDSSVSSTMLPDFLSDGPIIHSSQRIADVAVGLPSNSMGSPDESAMVTHLSRVLLDNERLQRELNEAREALSEQTRRANDLERQVHESLIRERTTASENQPASEAPKGSIFNKLQNQIVLMRSEIERLRRENDLLKDGGAYGGFDESGNVPSSSNARNQRPSRPQNFSRDLRLAASTAENHLRQLMTGVENLRQIAAHLEDTGFSTTDYDEYFPDYHDDLYNYEDYSGHAP